MILLFMNVDQALSDELSEFKYNQNKSLRLNEVNFLKITSRDCKNFGLKRDPLALTPQNILETFPKEISFLFFKKHIHTLCYYAVSYISKTIGEEFRPQVEELLLTQIESCFFSGKMRRPKLCDDLKNKAALFDLTVLLGHFCSKESLRVFKMINCEFEKIGKQECSLYQDTTKPLNKCPFYFSNKREAQELHRSYYSKNCKRPRWRKLKCLN